jgi:hypothetical protein
MNNPDAIRRQVPLGSRDPERWVPKGQETATVFLSCGQSSRVEVELATEVERRVRKLGYGCYLARFQHSSSGLKEAILGPLGVCDYFLFIDFAREVVDPTRGLHRGSLFSNQEMAIAVYLGIPILPFLQRGVERAGLLDAVLGNPVVFSNRGELPDLVERELRELTDSGKWSPSKRRALVVSRTPHQRSPPASVGMQGEVGVTGRGSARTGYWLQAEVTNAWHGLATDCHAYLECYRELPQGGVVQPDLVELKWSGVKTPTATIPPGASRMLDIVYYFDDAYLEARVAANPFLIDSSRVLDEFLLTGPAAFELGVVVFCREFGPTRALFELRLESPSTAPRLVLKVTSRGV